MYGKMIRQFGNKPASKTYYESDACVLITTWGNEGNGIGRMNNINLAKNHVETLSNW
jgi:hypothetical protein